jgi:[histone H3]-lysine36 N-trimethyltransferase
MLVALGIADEVEALQLKGTKKKKAKKLDEDFIVSNLLVIVKFEIQSGVL